MFRSDQALWYNLGVWGQLGYAVPNFGNDPTTLNSGIFKVTEMMGRNLSAIMHHPDVLSRTPPSINTLTRIHKMILRARTILGGRAVPSGQKNMDAVHTSPSEQATLIFPVPYFRVRNSWMKEYCGLTLNALSEAMQHTENAKPFEISEAFAGVVGQYLHRIYRLMATELFQVDVEEAKDLGYTMTQEILDSYNPSSVFSTTEMIDVVPPFSQIPTEDDLRVLTDGIPASHLVGLTKYPSDESPSEGQNEENEEGTTAKPEGTENAPAFYPHV